ncbi:acetylglutamate kinase [Marinoscillum sp. MHG1-6]|uniref:acetylglutamate kinase n=1 Tax=Marinoscillum sp. MHG1-6 TaxID=2959627 RepID=UPI0021576E67|nr:acetylglutamate kinase [Marinoscillum sp. MHG1-6]
MIKYGGNAMKDGNIKKAILDEIAAIHQAGHRAVLVHGGGPFINNLLHQLKIESEFVGGHRKTTDEAIKYIEMALTGEVNPDLVRSLQQRGVNAVGLSGKDGGLVIAEKMYHEDKGQKQDIGWVGKVNHVNPEVLNKLMDAGFFTVLTCMASGEDGQAYNINGDMFAGNIAGAVKADQYIVMTDVDGLCMDKDAPETLISHLKLDTIPELKGTVIAGGMIPKIESCEVAIESGTKEVRIINGTKPGTLKRVVLDGENIGTSITA